MCREAERLCAEAVLACLNRRKNLVCVQVMPSGNDHCVDAGILYDASSIGCAITENELLRGVMGMGSGSGADACQAGLSRRLQSRNKCPRGKNAGTEQSDG